MFDNIGGKIKTWAQIICWVGIVASVISGIGIMANNSFWVGLIVAAGGSLISWVSSFTLYGFGQLIESNEENRELLKENNDVLRTIASKLSKPSETKAASSTHTVNPSSVHTTSPVVQTASVTHTADTSSEHTFSPIVHASASSPASTVSPSAVPVEPLVIDDNCIQCPVCNQIQSKQRTRCMKCNSMFLSR